MGALQRMNRAALRWRTEPQRRWRLHAVLTLWGEARSVAFRRLALAWWQP